MKWTKNGTQVSTDATYTFAVTASASYVAHFQAQSYTISASVTPNNSGTVTGAGTYNYGQNCTLTATPSTGYNFVKWTKNGTQVSTDASYTFVVTASAAYVAHFQAQSYTINVSANPNNGGSVTGGGSYNYGQSCTVTATVASGYDFQNWTENGNQVSTNASYSFTVTGNRTLVANFTLQPTLPTVTTSQATSITQTTATGGGNVTSDGNATVTERGICWSTTHNPTTSGSHANNGTGTGSYSVNMTGLTANTTYYVRAYAINSAGTAYGNNEVSFTTAQIPNYTINVSANPTSGGTVSGGGTYQQGQICTVSATAATGYTFTNWTEGGTVVSTQANFTFTVNSNRTLVANFQQQTTDQTFTVNGVSFTMKRVEGGSFWIGAQSTNSSGQNYDSEAYDNESPVHSVTLSTFYMGETEVTQELWQAVMGSNPSYFSGTNLPVEEESWNMIVNQFLPALNAATGQNFRLPTEAEWEYAARGGNQGHGYKYAGSNTIGNVAWYDGNSNSQTHPVATKSPNELGLYDMSGNVWEWCSDWYGNYSSGSQTNPQGPSSGSYRVLRGGSWYNGAGRCRVSARGSHDPGNTYSNGGFRLALPQ